jgi:hypothetical protein
MRDTGWVDGLRVLDDDSGTRVTLRADGGIYAVSGDLFGSGVAPDGAAARRAAEDALRSMCRDVLAALDAPRPKCPDCDGVGGFSAHGKPSGAIVRPCLTCDGQRTVAAIDGGP